MATEIYKDITTVESGFIFHQVNCQNAMGRGVAKAISDKWPRVKTEYHRFCEGKEPENLLGEGQIVLIDSKLAVINIFGQLNYGNAARTGEVYTDYEAVRKAFSSLSLCLSFFKKPEIYFPYLFGCGLAGGDWAVMRPLITRFYPDVTFCRITG